MSYCVHCGVQLDQAERKCPLCGIEVNDPLQPFDETAIKAYPSKSDQLLDQINRRFAASMFSIIIAFPALLCLLIDLWLDGQISWSLYPFGALAIVWTVTVPFFLWKKAGFTRIYLPVAIVSLAYLFLIALLLDGMSWFLLLAMPLHILTSVLIYLAGLLIARKWVRGFAVPAMIFAAAGLLNTGIELVIRNFRERPPGLSWSLFVLLPCVSITIFLLTIARRQSIREEISRRLHV